MFREITEDSSALEEWWLRRESNPRHEDFQSSALPTELSRRGVDY